MKSVNFIGLRVLTLLLFLRTGVALSLGLFVWTVSTELFLGLPTMLALLGPVWLGGMCGGFVCVMAFGFLLIRHGYLGMPMGSDTFVTLWPMWFPPAYYVGAYGYLLFLHQSK
jgi:hypothetical protein